MKSPVVCHRYGVSERTLYRWVRSAAGEGAPDEAGPADPGTATSGPPPPVHDGEFHRDALRVVASTLSPDARERAVRALRTALRLSREGAERLLDVPGELDAAIDPLGGPDHPEVTELRVRRGFGQP